MTKAGDADLIRVRDERASDVSRIHSIQQAAFGRSAEAELVTLLRSEARPRISLVAEIREQVVDHVFFSPVEIETDSGVAPLATGLGPIGVDPDFQGRGVGAALIQAGLRHSLSVGWEAAFVLGNPAYYARFGFVPAAPLGFHYRSEAFES